jgi:small redox-active disulfide protein 2
MCSISSTDERLILEMGTRTKVRLLGIGCPKCKTLEERVRRLIAISRLDVEVEKVSDLREIMEYGIMTTPGLVVNGVVKSAGSVPEDAILLEWLKEQDHESSIQ